jgi:hypothetical protein
VQAYQRDGALPAARRLRMLKRKGFLRRARFLDQLHPLRLLQLAHSPAKLRRDLTEAIVELTQPRDFLLLVVVGASCCS